MRSGLSLLGMDKVRSFAAILASMNAAAGNTSIQATIKFQGHCMSGTERKRIEVRLRNILRASIKNARTADKASKSSKVFRARKKKKE